MNPESYATMASEQARSGEEIKNWISKKIAEALETDVGSIDPDQDFSDFGLDSMVAFALTGEMSEWIGKELPASLLWEYTTINSLSEYIAEPSLSHPVDEWPASSAVLLAGNGEGQRLFCICGIGLYKDLADCVATDANTYGVYVPPEKSLGKFGKEIDDRYAYSTVEALAESYVDQIVSLQPRGPYQLLGLSFGGVLAYETAQQLIRRGEDVPLLVLLDSVLPGGVKAGAYRHVVNLIKNAVSKPELDKSVLEDQKEQLSYEDMGTFRSEYYWALSKKYSPLPYAGTVLLIRATAEELFGRGYTLDEQLGWQDLVTGRLETIRLEGTHTGILQQPHVSELASVVRARMV